MQFEVKSGHLTITDPCYTRDTWCMIPKHPALNGTWYADVEEYEFEKGRIAKLVAHHERHSKHDADITHIGEIGVDSGQAGIFDEGTYPSDQETTGKLGSLRDLNRKAISFYDECCLKTCGDEGSGSVKHFGSGAVSSSGYGDGSYDVSGKIEDGKLVAVQITFIEDEEE